MKLKKILATATLGATMFVCGHFNAASAQDIWYDSDEYNNQWYVRSESIKRDRGTDIKCDSVLVYPNGKYLVTHEVFKYAVRQWNYQVRKGTYTPITNDDHYVKMFDVVRRHLGI